MRPVTISSSDASGGTVYSPTCPLDSGYSDEVALQAVVTGTATYTIEQTLTDPYGAAALTWFDHSDSNLVGATASKQGNYEFVPRAVRIKQTGGSGSVALIISQPTRAL
jgi:hypothetical protein